MLYVNDKNSGILVFDNLGNYKKKLPFPQLNFFSFYNDELYFVQQGKLHFINIYTLAQRDLNLPNKQPIQQAVVAGKILFLLSDTSLLIYKLLWIVFVNVLQQIEQEIVFLHVTLAIF